eukprot:tig00020610_g12064.t1
MPGESRGAAYRRRRFSGLQQHFNPPLVFILCILCGAALRACGALGEVGPERSHVEAAQDGIWLLRVREGESAAVRLPCGREDCSGLVAVLQRLPARGRIYPVHPDGRREDQPVAAAPATLPSFSVVFEAESEGAAQGAADRPRKEERKEGDEFEVAAADPALNAAVVHTATVALLLEPPAPPRAASDAPAGERPAPPPAAAAAAGRRLLQAAAPAEYASNVAWGVLEAGAGPDGASWVAVSRTTAATSPISSLAGQPLSLGTTARGFANRTLVTGDTARGIRVLSTASGSVLASLPAVPWVRRACAVVYPHQRALAALITDDSGGRCPVSAHCVVRVSLSDGAYAAPAATAPATSAAAVALGVCAMDPLADAFFFVAERPARAVLRCPLAAPGAPAAACTARAVAAGSTVRISSLMFDYEAGLLIAGVDDRADDSHALRTFDMATGALAPWGAQSGVLPSSSKYLYVQSLDVKNKAVFMSYVLSDGSAGLLGLAAAAAGPFLAAPLPGAQRLSALASDGEVYGLGGAIAWGAGTANGTAGVPAQFVMQATDAAGSPVGVGGEVFGATLEGPRAAPVTVTDALNGTYVGAWSAVVAGAYRLSVVTLGGKGRHIAGSPFNVTVVHAASDAGQSEIRWAVSDSLKVNVQVALFDAFKNPVVSGAPVLNVSTVPEAASFVQRPLGGNLWDVEFNLTAFQQYNFSLTVDGRGPISGAPLAMNIVRGRAVPAHTVVSGTGLSAATVGQAASFTVQTRDLFFFACDTGALASAVTASVVVGPTDAFVPSLVGTTAAAPAVAESAQGLWQVSYTPQNIKSFAGYTAQVSVLVNGVAVPGSPFLVTVARVVLPPLPVIAPTAAGDGAFFSVDATDATGSATAATVNMPAWILTLGSASRDQNLYPSGSITSLQWGLVEAPPRSLLTLVSADGLTFTDFPAGAVFPGAPLQLTNLNTRGRYLFNLTVSNDLGASATATLSVTVLARAFQTVNVSFTTGQDLASVQAQLAGAATRTNYLRQLAALLGVQISNSGARLLDAHAMPSDTGAGNVSVLIPPLQTGDPICALATGLRSIPVGRASPDGTSVSIARGLNVTVIGDAARTSAAASRLEGPFSTEATQLRTLAVRAFDTGNYSRCAGGDSVVVTASSSALEIGPIVDVGDGNYTFTYRSAVSGAYGLVVTINGAPVADVASFAITITAGPVDPSQTLVELAAELEAGRESSFVVRVRDSAGNLRPYNSYSASFVGNASSNLGVALPMGNPTQRDGPGSPYVVTFVANIKGTYELVVAIDGVVAPRAPLVLRVVVGATNASRSYVAETCSQEVGLLDVVSPCQRAPGAAVLDSLRAGVNASYFVLATDSYGNARETPGDVFVATLVWTGGEAADNLASSAPPGPATFVGAYQGGGLYRIDVNATVSGTYVLSIALQTGTALLPVGAFRGSDALPFFASAWPAPIAIRASRPRGRYSRLEGYDPSAAPKYSAGTGINGRVIAADLWGNPRRAPFVFDGSALVLTFDVSVATPARPDMLVQNSALSNADGTYSTSVNVTAVGAYNLNVTVGGEHIVGSPFVIVLLPGPPSPKGSFSNGTGADGGGKAQAGVAQPLVTWVADEYGNIATGRARSSASTAARRLQQAPAVLVSITAPADIEEGLVPFRGPTEPTVNPDDPTGSSFLTTWTPLVSGEFTVAVTMDGVPIKGSPYVVPVQMTSAPVFLSATFVPAGNGLEISFDRDTDRGGVLAPFFNCSVVIDASFGPLRPLSQAFGVGHRCSWNSASMLSVVFGTNADIQPGELVGLRRQVIRGAEPGSADARGAKALGLPANPLKTVASINAPLRIGECDGVSLDASASSGGAARPLRFRWSVAFDAPNATEILAIFAGLVPNASRVAIPANLMRLDFTYAFTVAVSNFLGSTSFATARVEKTRLTLPKISIAGSATVSARRNPLVANDIVILSGIAEQSPCIAPEIAALNPLDFTWSLASSEVPLLSLPPSASSPAVLAASLRMAVPTAAMAVAKPYTFRLRGQQRSNATLFSDAFVTVRLQPNLISARITGGNFREVVYENNFFVTAVPLDPDSVDGETWGFVWSCTDLASKAPCACATGAATCSVNPLAPVNEPNPTEPNPARGFRSQLVIAAGDLLDNREYLFNVTITKGGAGVPRRDSTFVQIRVKPRVVETAGQQQVETVPIVAIQPLRTSRANANDDLRLQGSSNIPGEPNAVFAYRWSVLNQPKSVIDLDDPAVLLVPDRYRSSLVVRAGALVPGASYTFQLKAKVNPAGAAANAAASPAVLAKLWADDTTGVGQARLLVRVAVPPSGGFVELNATEGDMLSSYFEIRADQWAADPELLPIKYQVAYRTSPASPVAYFPAAPEEKSTFVLGPFPAGGFPNNQIELNMTIVDQSGSAAVETLRITSKPVTVSLEKIAAVAGQATALKNTGSFDSVFFLANTIGGVLNTKAGVQTDRSGATVSVGTGTGTGAGGTGTGVSTITTAADKAKEQAVRGTMLSAILVATQTVTVVTGETAAAGVSAVAAITGNPQTLTPAMRETSLNIVGSLLTSAVTGGSKSGTNTARNETGTNATTTEAVQTAAANAKAVQAIPFSAAQSVVNVVNNVIASIQISVVNVATAKYNKNSGKGAAPLRHLLLAPETVLPAPPSGEGAAGGAGGGGAATQGAVRRPFLRHLLQVTPTPTPLLAANATGNATASNSTASNSTASNSTTAAPTAAPTAAAAAPVAPVAPTPTPAPAQPTAAPAPTEAPGPTPAPLTPEEEEALMKEEAVPGQNAQQLSTPLVAITSQRADDASVGGTVTNTTGVNGLPGTSMKLPMNAGQTVAAARRRRLSGLEAELAGSDFGNGTLAAGSVGGATDAHGRRIRQAGEGGESGAASGAADFTQSDQAASNTIDIVQAETPSDLFTFLKNAKGLGSNVASLTLHDAAGAEIPFSSTEPVVLYVPQVSPTGVPACTWVNHTAGILSRKGCALGDIARDGPNGTVMAVCFCWHLTDFATETEGAEDFLPTFNSVDPIGDASLFLTMDIYNAGCIFVIGALWLFYLVCCAVGWWIDRKQRRAFKEKMAAAAKIAEVEALQPKAARAQGGAGWGNLRAAKATAFMKTPNQLRKEELAKTKGFWAKLKVGMRHMFTTNHILISIFVVEPYDPYTRPRRLTCLLAFATGTLAINAIFFGTGDANSAGAWTRKIISSVIAAVALFPAKIFFVYMFRKVAPALAKRTGPQPPPMIGAGAVLPPRRRTIFAVVEGEEEDLKKGGKDGKDGKEGSDGKVAPEAAVPVSSKAGVGLVVTADTARAGGKAGPGGGDGGKSARGGGGDGSKTARGGGVTFRAGAPSARGPDGQALPLALAVRMQVRAGGASARRPGVPDPISRAVTRIQATYRGHRTRKNWAKIEAQARAERAARDLVRAAAAGGAPLPLPRAESDEDLTDGFNAIGAVGIGIFTPPGAPPPPPPPPAGPGEGAPRPRRQPRPASGHEVGPVIPHFLAGAAGEGRRRPGPRGSSSGSGSGSESPSHLPLAARNEPLGGVPPPRGPGPAAPSRAVAFAGFAHGAARAARRARRRRRLLRRLPDGLGRLAAPGAAPPRARPAPAPPHGRPFASLPRPRPRHSPRGGLAAPRAAAAAAPAAAAPAVPRASSSASSSQSSAARWALPTGAAAADSERVQRAAVMLQRVWRGHAVRAKIHALKTGIRAAPPPPPPPPLPFGEMMRPRRRVLPPMADRPQPPPIPAGVAALKGRPLTPAEAVAAAAAAKGAKGAKGEAPAPRGGSPAAGGAPLPHFLRPTFSENAEAAARRIQSAWRGHRYRSTTLDAAVVQEAVRRRMKRFKHEKKVEELKKQAEGKGVFAQALAAARVYELQAKKTPPPPQPLPWFLAYAGYIFSLLFSAFCSYLVILYGLKFSADQREGWLQSTGLSQAQDWFGMEPLLLFLRAFREVALPGLDILFLAIMALKDQIFGD